MSWDDARSLADIMASVHAWEQAPPPDATRLRICLLRNFSIEPMLPLLKHCCQQAGLQASISVGGYDTILQDVLELDSPVHSESPDIVVVAWHLEHLDPASVAHDWDPGFAIDTTTRILTELVARTPVTIVVNTLLAPPHQEDSLRSASLPTHRVRRVEAVNEGIRNLANASNGRIVLLDASRIVQAIGWGRALDPRFGYLYRAPFGRDFLGHFADGIAAVGRALKGKARKCLVLDCDNTLWGGVVGEIGTDGIALDPHEYPGRCYHDFQRSVLNLVEHGVLVALCSKNNEVDVLDVIDRHPHCLLRREHLAAWRIDWNDKPANIRALARELNLGLDSMVFIDDSTMECAAVREMLPEVGVLQAPAEPAYLPPLAYAGGLFDRITSTAEDSDRSRMYAEERNRQQAFGEAGTIEDYLASLGLVARIGPAQPQDLARVAQLLGKTNQFNLTTRRHAEGAVRAFSEDPDRAVQVLSAMDRFGDMGLVGVLIAERRGDQGTVDSLLMSCRALGRRLEYAFVDACLSTLEADWGIHRWRASYVPTARNGQVADFWPRVGFEETERDDSTTRYTIDVARRKPQPVPFIEIQGRMT